MDRHIFVRVTMPPDWTHPSLFSMISMDFVRSYCTWRGGIMFALTFLLSIPLSILYWKMPRSWLQYSWTIRSMIYGTGSMLG